MRSGVYRGGALLLREVDGKIDLLGRLARFASRTSVGQLLVKHHLSEMLAQRSTSGTGYEDLNEHQQLALRSAVCPGERQRELDQPLAVKAP